MEPVITDAMVEQFRKLDTCCLSDAMDRLGLAFTEPSTATGAQKDYYILEFAKEAPLSDFDLRGH